MTRGFWRAPAAVAGIEGASLLVGLLLQPLLMRELEPAAYGAYVLSVAAGSMAGSLVDAGSNYTGVQRLLDAGTDSSAQARCFWLIQKAKLCVAGLVLMLCFGVAAAAAAGGASSWTIATAVCVSVGLGAASAILVPTWFLYALNRSVRCASYLFAARAAAVPATLLLVHAPADLVWAVACTSGAPLLAAALALLEPAFRAVVRRPVGSRSDEVLAYLRQAGSSTGLPLLPMLNGLLLPALMSSLGSMQTAGLFGAADKLRTGAVGLSTAFANAAFPIAARLMGNGDRPQRRAALRIVATQPVAAMLLALPLAVWPGQTLELIAGDAYTAASSTLTVLSAAIVSSTLVGAIGVNLLVASGAARAHLMAAIGGLIALAFFLALWVPGHGAPGAAWAVLAADGVVLSLQLLQLRRMRACK